MGKNGNLRISKEKKIDIGKEYTIFEYDFKGFFEHEGEIEKNLSLLENHEGNVRVTKYTLLSATCPIGCEMQFNHAIACFHLAKCSCKRFFQKKVVCKHIHFLYGTFRQENHGIESLNENILIKKEECQIGNLLLNSTNICCNDELSYGELTEKEYEEGNWKANTGQNMREIIWQYQNEDFNFFDKEEEFDIYLENELMKKKKTLKESFREKIDLFIEWNEKRHMIEEDKIGKIEKQLKILENRLKEEKYIVEKERCERNKALVDCKKISENITIAFLKKELKVSAN